MRRGKHCSGLTLIELLAVISLIALLAVVLLKSAGPVRNKVEAVRCMQNLRSLHTALGAYTSNFGHWPQVPDGMVNPEQKAKFWIDELRKEGISEVNWRCPTLDRLLAEDKKNGNPADDRKVHYLPTEFDKNQGTPYRWSTQPWLVEIADMHGGGNLIIFPDGHIVGLTDYLESMKK